MNETANTNLNTCPTCGKPVSAQAASCPNCGHPFKPQSVKKKGGCLKTILIVIGVLIAIGIIGSLFGGNSSSTPKTSTKSDNTKDEKPIEYAAISVSKMMEDLGNNAMSAADTYKGKYLEITGKLNVIDSNGKYISLYSDDEFAITGVQCYIKTDEQKSAVAGMTKGDNITLRGKCTDVGEVLGYSLDIDSIIQ